jgi:hypothetical protein
VYGLIHRVIQYLSNEMHRLAPNHDYEKSSKKSLGKMLSYRHIF